MSIKLRGHVQTLGEYHRSHRWGTQKTFRMTSKPNETDSQTNIYIEVVNRIYGKTKSMLDWPLYTPSPNRECLYKVASPGKTPEKTESMLDWPLYTPPPTENASNTLSFERGPWGERGPGRTARARAKMASILKPFWRARGRAQDPIHPEDPFQGKFSSL